MPIIKAHEQLAVIEQVLALMSRLKISLENLVEVGGEDLKSSDPGRAGKARCVERGWALMARLGVKHSGLESALSREFSAAAVPEPAIRPRRRRGRTPIQKTTQNQGVNKNQAPLTKPNEIRDL